MNDISKSWIRFELQDAQEELTHIMDDLQNNSDYGAAEYQIAMAHLYHHINSAWNARHASMEDIESQEKYDEWEQFPKDIQPL